jgi:hypothetical protein
MMASSKMLRVPVVSGIEGLSAAVRLRLSTPAASSPSPSASQLLFRQSLLEIVDVPPPPPADTPWQLSKEQREAMERATVLLADASTGARLLLPVGDDKKLAARPQKLEWMQSTYAGIETFFRSLALQDTDALPSFTLTRAGGVMPVAMAQYVFGHVFMRCSD